MYTQLRNLLFKLDAERAHHMGLNALKIAQATGLMPDWYSSLPKNPITIAGLTFPNRIGLAAGLDKNAICVDALAALGFGHIEIGTLTPRPQTGNDLPRLFRLVKDKAIINRMGFNNDGVEEAVKRLQKRKSSAIVGVNIGKNKVTPNEQAMDDYRICLEMAYPVADFITINISSPNTPGLRDLQGGGELGNLLEAVVSGRKAFIQSGLQFKPIFLKIAPDLTDDQLRTIADTAIDNGIDAIIATNTTIDRDGLVSTEKEVLNAGAGGLSGAPLTVRSRAVLAVLIAHLGNKLPVISVGGIMDAEDAKHRLEMGAAMVQVYTGFVYAGPAWPAELVKATAI